MAQDASAHPATTPNPPLRCKGWRQEGLLRMLENTLANGERPAELIIYGGSGRVARDWPSYRGLTDALRDLDVEETLVVQSGRPVAKFRTFSTSPLVVIANANLVPRAATKQRFLELSSAGLTMQGQYTAGSWAYIGSQGIQQGTYETFAACAQARWGGSLAGRIVLTAGLGGMGQAQGPAVRMNGGMAIVCDIDAEKIQRRLASGHVDVVAANILEAWQLAEAEAARGAAKVIAVCANAADALETLLASDITPAVVTDQTSAHDLVSGYVPSGLSAEAAASLREGDPSEYEARATQTIARHARAILEMGRRGAFVFEYGNDLRQAAKRAGVTNAFDIPGFVPLFIRPEFAVGRGPMRWVCLSGDVADREALDAAARRLFPDDERLVRWLHHAGSLPVEGLPARTCWLGYGARRRMAQEINRLVRDGTLSGPVAITRDHLDSGSCAYPTRETEGMPDGSDEIADWPYLNAMLNTAGGADLVAIHQNAGDIGGSASAGMTVVCDGTAQTDERIAACFDADPGIGVVRHASAGVQEAVDFLSTSDINTTWPPQDAARNGVT